MNFIVVMADGTTYWVGGPNPYTGDRKQARRFGIFLDAQQVASTHPGSKVIAVNERLLRERAADVVRRACMDALDFGTELRTGYVLAVFENLHAGRGMSDEQLVVAEGVRERLKALGFDF